ncbi:MAG: hypothetical protein JW951_10500 [Lentisphaerae bacterium]|nr:hypothetical protein [Lentisphaerota bacterium]
MAHSALHFSLGMAAGTAVACRPLLRARRAGARLAPVYGRWLLLCYGLGCYAVIPSLLRRCGVSESVVSAGWMNVFLLHPLLTRLKPGGGLLGPAALLVCLTAQYAWLLLALRRLPASPPAAPRSAP